MHRRNSHHELVPALPGFVTSVLGLLIVLILVVGARARAVTLTRPAVDQSAPARLAAAEAAASRVEADVHSLVAQTKTVEQELVNRYQERLELATLKTAVEKELAARRAALDDSARVDYDLQRALALARADLARVDERQARLPPARSEVRTIENFPTPLSKTVDGREMHVQLRGGRLAVIPLDDLLAKFKSAAHEKVYKLKELPETTDTVGPIGGFRMRYTLERVDVPFEPGVRGGGGAYVQLAKWELVPVTAQLGEPIDQALQPNSQFRNQLSLLSPRDYTVTIWVYPDSFEEFRVLRKDLYHLGYAIAGRPLPDGTPIGGSPQGSKSAAE